MGINGVAESFFGNLKTELLYELPLQTRRATRHAVADYIENVYKVRRRHSSLDYQSPVEYELKHPRNGGFAPIPGCRASKPGRRRVLPLRPNKSVYRIGAESG